MKVWKYHELRAAVFQFGPLTFIVDLAADSYSYGRFAAIVAFGRRIINIPLS